MKSIITASEVELESLTSKRLAFDANSIIHGFLSIIRDKKGKPITDKKGNVTSHLLPLFYRNVNFLQNDLKMIYVFDGKPPKLKKPLLEQREKRKKEANKKYQKALGAKNYVKARQIYQLTVSLDLQMIEDAKNLLKLMGIPVVQAKSEAEATAAHLNKTRRVYGVVAQDYDCLLFKTAKMIRNLTVTGKRKAPGSKKYHDITPELIERKKVLQRLGITQKQLVDTAILIGTDYNPHGFGGFGPKTAIQAIKKYKKLEKIPSIADKLNKIDYEEIRNLYFNPVVTKDIKINFKKPALSKIREFLVESRGFDKKRVENALEKLEVRSN